MWQAPGQAADAEGGEQLVDPRPVWAGKGHIGRDVQVGKEGVFLEHVAHAPLARRLHDPLLTVEPAVAVVVDPARVRLVEPGDAADNGGLARARGAGQRQQSAVLAGEGYLDLKFGQPFFDCHLKPHDHPVVPAGSGS